MMKWLTRCFYTYHVKFDHSFLQISSYMPLSQLVFYMTPCIFAQKAMLQLQGEQNQQRTQKRQTSTSLHVLLGC